MSGFRAHTPVVGFSDVRWKSLRQRDPGSGNAVIGRRKPGRICARVLAPPFFGLHDLDSDCAFGTRVDAGGFAPCAETSVTHVALPDDATLGVVLRHAIGAVPGAVLAADTSLSTVLNNASDRVFCVRLNWTADET